MSLPSLTALVFLALLTLALAPAYAADLGCVETLHGPQVR